jgi:hypothetical protein
MFKDKGNITTKKKHVDVKVTIAFSNMVDMHVATTKSKIIKVQKFKEHEPRKNKSLAKKVEEHTKKLMVETIQYMQVIDTHVEVPCTT